MHCVQYLSCISLIGQFTPPLLHVALFVNLACFGCELLRLIRGVFLISDIIELDVVLRKFFVEIMS